MTTAESQPREAVLLRVEEAADMLKISRATLYKLIMAGDLPSISIARTRRVPVDALRRWIDDRVAQGV